MALDLRLLQGTIITARFRLIRLPCFQDIFQSDERMGFPVEEWPQDLRMNIPIIRSGPGNCWRMRFPEGFKTNIVVDTASDLKLFEIIKTSFAGISAFEMECG